MQDVMQKLGSGTNLTAFQGLSLFHTSTLEHRLRAVTFAKTPSRSDHFFFGGSGANLAAPHYVMALDFWTLKHND
jgi:hypothetical protein